MEGHVDEGMSRWMGVLTDECMKDGSINGGWIERWLHGYMEAWVEDRWSAR